MSIESKCDTCTKNIPHGPTADDPLGEPYCSAGAWEGHDIDPWQHCADYVEQPEEVA